MPRRTKIAAFGVALLLAGGVTVGTTAASATGGQREAAALTGTAKLYRSAGDDITFTFDARLAAEDTADPMKATGTFSFSHYRESGGAWAKAEVDCLVTGGSVAVVSGVITDSDLPGAEGKRVGVTVHDLGLDHRLGYSWGDDRQPGTDAEGPAEVRQRLFFEKVRRGMGDFTVVPWQPRL
ncbi:Repetin OS=Streptomyces glaucescens OX=1907 GN=SGLAU_05860 PE=4 SV=1 [Streptomyces glaucescens]